MKNVIQIKARQLKEHLDALKKEDSDSTISDQLTLLNETLRCATTLVETLEEELEAA